MNDLAKARDFPNRLLCFSDVMFTCQGKLGEFMSASKRANTFVLVFIAEKSTPLIFLVLFYTPFPNDFGETKQNYQKNACISLLNYST